MFNTTLTNEYVRSARSFNWDMDRVESLVMNAARATLLPVDQKTQLIHNVQMQFNELKGRIQLNAGENS
jgi:hypothetical protein